MMHLRPPSIAHGVTSFLWALFFGVLIWIGGSFLGFNGGMTFIVGAVAAFLIFVFVRVYGEDDPARP
jgi:lipopolysaccharide export LptBFGC system permease protein LptF